MLENRCFLYRPGHAICKAIEAYPLSQIKLARPVLDIGCGDGWTVSCWYKDKIDMGIDLHEANPELAIKTGFYEDARVEDATVLNFPDGSFNSILSICAIEHIPDLEKVLKRVHALLRNNGVFVFTVPNKNLGDMLFTTVVLKKLKLNRLAEKYAGSKNRRSQHFHMYNGEEWKNILLKAGLATERCSKIFPRRGVILWSFLNSVLFKTIFLPFRIVRGLKIRLVDNFLRSIYSKVFAPFVEKTALNQDSLQGGYLLIIARKKS
ncbi:MAG: class I SAM-dependent methyltransferase [Endomicrobiia bacterium]|nr:class I SAM-dependent methyltransferase [Endomicrobiia bacterium]